MGFDAVYAHFTCDICDREEQVWLETTGGGTVYAVDDVYAAIERCGWKLQGSGFDYSLCADCFKPIRSKLVTVKAENDKDVTVEMAHGSVEDGIGMMFHEFVAVVVRDGKVVRRLGGGRTNRQRTREVGFEWRDKTRQNLWVLVESGGDRPGYDLEWCDSTDEVYINVPDENEPSGWSEIRDIFGDEEHAIKSAREMGPGRYLLTRRPDLSVICELLVNEDGTVIRKEE